MKKKRVFFVIPNDFGIVRDYLDCKTFTDVTPEYVRDTIEEKFDCKDQIVFYTTTIGFMDAIKAGELDLGKNSIAIVDFEENNL